MTLTVVSGCNEADTQCNAAAAAFYSVEGSDNSMTTDSNGADARR